MTFITQITNKLQAFFEAIFRYPLTIAFFLAATILNAISIETNSDHTQLFLTFLIGAFLSLIVQAGWERFFSKLSLRFVFYGLSLLLTFGYYLIVNQNSSTNQETWIRTLISVFALFIAFILIPSIKNTEDFNESFMSVFKAFFNTLLFSGVLFGGMALIIAATDLLLFPVSENAFIHSLNFTGCLFSPIYFLSLIPIYNGSYYNQLSENKRLLNREKKEKAFQCPRFLEILLSYLIIPLLTIYTVILILYIILNITGEFWQDNLLEPMLVGFSITVILIYILVSHLDNRITNLYRIVFPKLLIPIVCFQIVASILKIQSTGITFTRYDVILYGIFAAISGFIFSILPVRKNGIVGALLIFFLLFSVIPPLDAFTVARKNQTNRLTAILTANEMLKENNIIPNPDLSQEEQIQISETTAYLYRMEYTDSIDYFKKDFDYYTDFYDTFGFYATGSPTRNKNFIYLSLNQEKPIEITGFDQLIFLYDYHDNDMSSEPTTYSFYQEDKLYKLQKSDSTPPGSVVLYDEADNILLSIDLLAVYSYFENEQVYQMTETFISPDNATVNFENNVAKISIIPIYISIEKDTTETDYRGDFYVLVKIK